MLFNFQDFNKEHLSILSSSVKNRRGAVFRMRFASLNLLRLIQALQSLLFLEDTHRKYFPYKSLKCIIVFRGEDKN